MSGSDSGSSTSSRSLELMKKPVRWLIKTGKFMDKTAKGFVSIKDRSIMSVMKEGVRVINEAYDDTFREQS